MTEERKGPVLGEDYEDISHEIYPERVLSDKPKGFWTYGDDFIQLRSQSKIHRALQENPLVKLLVSALKSKGCVVDPERHIVAENCEGDVTGGYDTRNNQIVVCKNKVYTQSMTQSVLAHELIHMFDYCRAKLDFNNLEHIACTEIRAANLVHCSITSSMFIGTTKPWNIAKTHRECVRAKAIASIINVRKNFPIEDAMAIVDRVFDKCYEDLEPIGRRIRRNSKHMEWAYRERFHYDYDSFA